MKAKLRLDNEDILKAEVREKTITVDIVNHLKLLRTPSLVKLGLNLKSLVGTGSYNIKINKNFFKNVFSK